MKDHDSAFGRSCNEASHLPLQGLADAFILLGMPFDSAEAKQLNKEIFEAIYFAALETSCELAKLDGARLLLALRSQNPVCEKRCP